MQSLDFQNYRPPIILIGMHRSGTSLVSSLLQQMAVHMGTDTSRTDESVFFRELNQRLLRRASAKWFRPNPMWEVLSNQDRMQSFARQLHSDCCSRGLHRFGEIPSQTARWGWKDPRTTLALPIWLELFPEARIVHVVRNGIDVADSLLRRSKLKKPFRWKVRIRAAAQTFIPALPGPIRGLPIPKHRFQSLAEAFKLWQDYLQFAHHGVRDLPKDRVHTLRFEDLALNPSFELNRLARFIQSSQTDTRIDELARVINRKRAWSFESNTELKKFAGQYANVPAMLRYKYVSKSGVLATADSM